ncbi:hypothetical protein XH96_08570 [Bradyrhizobium sp. CCBAU 51765]|nr:hypothetical protein [Bradyrhizobium sp. CCBAU 21360]QOZ07568.1 hypothetical protein XH96_08570 [Bradyrhizobium sp. CCBAU 51765]
MQDAGEDRQMHLGMFASWVARGLITAAGGGNPAKGRSSRLCKSHISGIRHTPVIVRSSQEKEPVSMGFSDDVRLAN